MAFKGITWAGNIYQKFETMCLEVEEVMYKDTVKYVENQVQKVGVSVKKFYSEAIQDLLPPSCIEPVKSPSTLSLNPYTEADIKKPKLSILDGKAEINNKNTEDEVVKESCISVSNDVNHLSPRNSRVLVENTRPQLHSARNKVGIHKRSNGIKRISQNNRPVKVSSPVISPASEKIVSAESQRQKKENSVCTSSVTDKILSAENGRPNMDGSDLPGTDKSLSVKSMRRKMDDLESSSPACDKIEYAESHRETQNKDNTGCSSSADEINFSETGREKKCDSGCTSSIRSLPSESTSMNRNSVSKSSSSIRSNECEVEYVAEGIVMPDEDDFDMEVIENEEVAEPNLEGIEPVEKTKLDESCVYVEGNELHLDQWIKKHKSYKKKIREALSSKLRSPRKQDQLVPHSKEKNSAIANESLESDWELL